MLTDSTFSMLVMRTRFSGWEARRGDDNTRQMNPSLPSTRHYHIPHWYHRVTQCKRTGRDKQMEAKASRLAAASTCLMIMHALINVNAAVPWGLFHLWQFITVSSATDVPLTTPLALVINMIGRGPHIDRLKAGIARHDRHVTLARCHESYARSSNRSTNFNYTATLFDAIITFPACVANSPTYRPI